MATFVSRGVAADALLVTPAAVRRERQSPTSDGRGSTFRVVLPVDCENALSDRTYIDDVREH